MRYLNMEKTETGMVKVVGVRFRTAGKIYYFDPGDFELSRGSHVIVETARGLEYGFVVGPPMEVEEKDITQPLKAVIRISTEEDDRREKKNREREREAFWICREKILKRGLDMKLIDAEYTFDNSKVLFYFTADGRVDFRELVKDLAGVFRTRIELRQVGVRDETKILGGYGSCGRPLCCHTWLSDFVPVSIKMAKEQNLSLNPGKISGVCGRLMCCLKNEAEIYEELNKTLPHPGDEVESTDGLNGLIESVNILRQTARVIVEVDDEKELHEYHVSDLTILRRRRRGTSRPTIQKNANVQKGGSRQAGGKEKDAKEKDAKETRDGKEGREGREGRQGKEARDRKDERREDGRENRREPREGRDGRENRESREGRESREPREGRGRSGGFRENSGREGGRNNSPRDNSFKESREPGSRDNGFRNAEGGFEGRSNSSAENTDRRNGDRAERDNQEQTGGGRERGRRDRGRNRGDRRREGRPRREDGGDSTSSANSEKAPQ